MVAAIRRLKWVNFLQWFRRLIWISVFNLIVHLPIKNAFSNHLGTLLLVTIQFQRKSRKTDTFPEFLLYLFLSKKNIWSWFSTQFTSYFSCFIDGCSFVKNALLNINHITIQDDVWFWKISCFLPTTENTVNSVRRKIDVVNQKRLFASLTFCWHFTMPCASLIWGAFFDVLIE